MLCGPPRWRTISLLKKKKCVVLLYALHLYLYCYLHVPPSLVVSIQYNLEQVSPAFSSVVFVASTVVSVHSSTTMYFVHPAIRLTTFVNRVMLEI